MNRRILLADLAIAALVALLILLLTPGLAISGIIGLLVLLVLGLTAFVARWRRRSSRYRGPDHRHGPHGRTRLR